MRGIEPEGWAPPKGYSNGTLAEGRLLHVAGQVGWDPKTGRFEARGFVEQAAQALRNVLAVVEAAGGGPEHVARLTWYVTDKREYLARSREMGEAYRAAMGRRFPAMTMVVVAGLVEDEALVEIEATAVLPAKG